MSDRIDLGSKPWKAIPRDVLRDKRLSVQAKGGLVTLLSHEDGWVRSVIAILMKENRRCGRKQAKAIMRELCDAGYAELSQSRMAGGRFATGYTVSAESRSTAETSPSPGPVPGGPVPGGPVKGAAVVEPPEEEPQDVEPQVLELAPRRATGAIPDTPFNALAVLDGGPEGMTSEALTLIGVKLAAIRKATPGVGPEEIRRRAANYSTHFTATLTASALAKHWARCAVPRPSTKRRDPGGERMRQALAEMGGGDGNGTNEDARRALGSGVR